MFFVERQGRESVKTLDLPCGQCVGCRLERSRQWAVRCVHEAQMHESSVFVTLTYETTGYSLVYRDFQLFMKRLRKSTGREVRFFCAGEYGDTNGRPHFHACLFGLDFPDRELYSTRGGFKLYTSKFLDRVWRHGIAVFGDVSFESAAYCARYLMKKLTGDGNDDYYDIFDPETGEIFPRRKEFCRMSLKPGIGAKWLARYLRDVYPRGKVVIGGKEANPPKYYDRKYKDQFPDEFEVLAFQRELDAVLRSADNTNERLAVKRQVTTARVKLFNRSL